jgi:prefoldin subunit 5
VNCGFIFQEEQNKGKPNWDHLNDEVHVLLTVEDTSNRAEAKLKKAVEEVKKLLVPAVSVYFIKLLKNVTRKLKKLLVPAKSVYFIKLLFKECLKNDWSLQ